jgi:hypothetical protein
MSEIRRRGKSTILGEWGGGINTVPISTYWLCVCLKVFIIVCLLIFYTNLYFPPVLKTILSFSHDRVI